MSARHEARHAIKVVEQKSSRLFHIKNSRFTSLARFLDTLSCRGMRLEERGLLVKKSLARLLVKPFAAALFKVVEKVRHAVRQMMPLLPDLIQRLVSQL